MYFKMAMYVAILYKEFESPWILVSRDTRTNPSADIVGLFYY